MTPAEFRRLTSPLPPNAETARAERVVPDSTVIVEDAGLVAPAGQTFSEVVDVGQLAVTVRATEPTPLAGTPPAPSTCRSSRWAGPSGRCPPVRLS